MVDYDNTYLLLSNYATRQDHRIMFVIKIKYLKNHVSTDMTTFLSQT